MSIRPSAAAVVAALLLLGAVGLGTARAAPGEPPGPTRPDPCASVLAGDFDGDGLSNYQECQLGTDPFHIDTDRDGLGDLHELDIGTSPTNANTDRDALKDGCDYTLGNGWDMAVDPAVFDPDTDADGIPDAVEAWGGTNPTSNDTDQDILFDGEEWIPCFQFRSGGVNLNDLYFFTKALDPDRDLDGIDDGIEVKSIGTDPDLYDTDGDWWSDHAEWFVYGTDPLDASDEPSGYPPDHP